MSNINIKETYKSLDTEEWLDIHFTRPLGFLWAKFFNAFNIHPNVVTILSIFLGIGAGIMFYYPDLTHNIIGVVLLVWANLYDSCDGQLARMTGKKTQWGRILDGFAGDVWFVTIYFALCFRMWNEEIPFTHIHWQYWGFILLAFSGFICHARQCQLSDYYRNIHLHFLPNTASELHSSIAEKEKLKNTPKEGNFWWRLFLVNYIKYTQTQEKLTPKFQQLMHFINKEQGGEVSTAFCEEFRKGSLPLMKYANIVTFNCRAITLYIACLLNMPWLYPVVEITLFTGISYYMQHKHETLCFNLLQKLKNHQL